MQKHWILGAALTLPSALAMAAPPPSPTGNGQAPQTPKSDEPGPASATPGTGLQTEKSIKGTEAGQVNPKSGIQLPTSATLVGESQVTEVRELPELYGSTRTLTPRSTEIERVVGVNAVDRVYSTRDSYHSTVSFFDRQFKQEGYKQLARNVAATSTAWSVRLPTGSVATAVVRNTNPTTIEVVQAVGAAAEIPVPSPATPQYPGGPNQANQGNPGMPGTPNPPDKAPSPQP